MKSFEPIYKELEYLFIEKLPEYIEKVNKEHNDGIILKPFANKNLTEECIKFPCFKFDLEEVEYMEKDRIIENNIFCFSIEFHFNCKSIIERDRYEQAFELLINENKEMFLEFKITKMNKNIIFFKIVI